MIAAQNNVPFIRISGELTMISSVSRTMQQDLLHQVMHIGKQVTTICQHFGMAV
jgi:hypothetical protein